MLVSKSSPPSEADALARLHALVTAALDIADGLDLHAVGIALDTARLAVETEMDAPRGSDPAGPLPPS